ncbi:MAG: hypothetical protein CVU73_15290 [Deltaproteobacteria bacterium HGW-Deltaproteobacteria-8]|jgi:phage terminase Nu1 subunit (DNA packaging protein)|nr:MAG: hypothetical protein CVU73_15290 [Deltaproteobacteria bacterium HGW-Deltaproteobacteria-8]
MPESLSKQLLNLADVLTEIACESTGATSARAFDLSQDCRYYATKAALLALKKSEPGYKEIQDALNKAAEKAEEANQKLSDVARKIAAVADALNLATRLIQVIVGVLGL